MTLSDIIKRSGKTLGDNSPTLLTAFGVTGVLTTAYLTGIATIKAVEIINDEESRPISDFVIPLEPKDKVQLTWKLYIPAIGMGVVTCGCIIAANRIGTRRAAAMAAAYSLSERAYSEYREKIVERVGENKERAYRDEIAQERIDRDPVDDSKVIILDPEGVLCYEPYTGRYFKSSMEALKKAQNDTNYRVINDCYASLTTFYNFLGIPQTRMSDDVGWSSNELLELDISAALSEDGRPCLSIDYKVVPIRDYDKVH